MSPLMFDPDERPPQDTHQIVVFFAVAVIVLGALLIFARFASGEEVEYALDPTAVPQGGPGAEAPPAESAIEAQPAIELVEAPPVSAPAASLPVPSVVPTALPPPVSASAYAIVERSCGALLFGVNEHERLPPASLTKIMTALVVGKYPEHRRDKADVTVSGSAMAKRGSSVMGLEPGMNVNVEDLLYGLMLPSGNDAALTLASYFGHGNVQSFIDAMNEETAALGLTNTHFANPHGLDAADHYSSPYDMAMMGGALLNDPYLAGISNEPRYKVGDITLKNGNKLLQQYPGAFGVKIGYTEKANQTIVAAADHGGRQLIISVFGSDNRYVDTAALLDWAFANLPYGCNP